VRNSLKQRCSNVSLHGVCSNTYVLSDVDCLPLLGPWLAANIFGLRALKNRYSIRCLTKSLLNTEIKTISEINVIHCQNKIGPCNIQNQNRSFYIFAQRKKQKIQTSLASTNNTAAIK